MKNTAAKSIRLLLAIILSLLVYVPPATAKTIGMVADSAAGAVTVFDTDSDTILGSVLLGISGTVGDVSITNDQTKGFVTDGNSHIWIIDLTTSPPSLASGINPILISNFGEDTSISPDGKFLLVCDGSAPQPVSVIDIATRAQISTFNLGTDCNSVDICSNGSVLVTSANTGNVRRLMINSLGILTDTGEVLFSGGTGVTNGPNNVFCAPGGTSGVVIRREPREIRSFTIPGLALVNTRPLTGTQFSGISGVVNAQGDRVFALSNGGAVDVFSYNPTTAALSNAPLFSIPVASDSTFYGMDQITLTPDGKKLYVSQPNALKVYDARTGAFLKSITGTNIIAPTGVGFAKGFLNFPLHVNNQADGLPLNPDTVQINSVFDHHVRTVNNVPLFYINDQDHVVTAYTGEVGSRDACKSNPNLKSCTDDAGEGVVGYKNSTGTNFSINNNYSGGVYLYYDGHPGFDYQAERGTPVFAAAEGIAFIPDSDPITSSKNPTKAVDTFNILVIDHGNGYSTWYLHLGTDSPKADFRLIKCPGDSTEFKLIDAQTIQHQIPINTGCQIAKVGDKGVKGHPHLHFEVRIGLTKDSSGKYHCDPGICMPVDPYGWTDPDLSHKDPYIMPNRRLWR